MNQHIAAVVDGFRRLSADDKVAAYLDIEEIWKALQTEPARKRNARASHS